MFLQRLDRRERVKRASSMPLGLVLGARIASKSQHRHLFGVDERLDRRKRSVAHFARPITGVGRTRAEGQTARDQHCEETCERR